MGLLTNPNSGSGAGGVGAMLRAHANKAAWALYALGVAAFFALPHHEYSHKTYFSENALLPGLVRGEFDEDAAATRFVIETIIVIYNVTQLFLSFPAIWKT